MIGLGALLSTASAINATLFGTTRLGMVMAQDKALPRIFSFRERTKDIPWVSLVVITLVILIFVDVTDLTLISSFASSTFLLIFIFINFSAIQLREQIHMGWVYPLLGFIFSLTSWFILMVYLWRTDIKALIWLGGFYFAVAIAEFLFSKRSLLACAKRYI